MSNVTLYLENDKYVCCVKLVCDAVLLLFFHTIECNAANTAMYFEASSGPIVGSYFGPTEFLSNISARYTLVSVLINTTYLINHMCSVCNIAFRE